MLLWREKIPDFWLPQVRSDLGSVLNDHAHLERKAATSALNLEKYPEIWEHVSELNAIAIEELQHFELVLASFSVAFKFLQRFHFKITFHLIPGPLKKIFKSKVGPRFPLSSEKVHF